MNNDLTEDEGFAEDSYKDLQARIAQAKIKALQGAGNALSDLSKKIAEDASVLIPTDKELLWERVELLLKRIAVLEDAIKYVVTQEDDDICWMDSYTHLASLVGINYVPALICDKEKHLKNCDRFYDSMKGGEYTPVYVRKNSIFVSVMTLSPVIMFGLISIFLVGVAVGYWCR